MSSNTIDPFPRDKGEKREYIVKAKFNFQVGDRYFTGGDRLLLPVEWIDKMRHPDASCPHQLREATAPPKVAEKAPDEAPAELGVRTRSITSPPKRKAKKKKN